jgi:hypothetical protein
MIQTANRALTPTMTSKIPMVVKNTPRVTADLLFPLRRTRSAPGRSFLQGSKSRAKHDERDFLCRRRRQWAGPGRSGFAIMAMKP